MAQKKPGMKTGTAVALGAGALVLGAAAYLLFGPEGKKNRKKVGTWAHKMKMEIHDKLEKAKDLSEPVYKKIVAEVGEKYKAMKDVDPKKVAAEIASLKKSWGAIVKKANVRPKAGVKKAVKKTVKKAAPKKKSSKKAKR